MFDLILWSVFGGRGAGEVVVGGAVVCGAIAEMSVSMTMPLIFFICNTAL